MPIYKIIDTLLAANNVASSFGYKCVPLCVVCLILTARTRASSAWLGGQLVDSRCAHYRSSSFGTRFSADMSLS